MLPDAGGVFGPGTRAAVEAFQHLRGLRVDGTCGPQTWAALVEAGFRLGDRFLYHRRAMLRGDDVAELQRRLSALGFDAGRVDGIFGPRTALALGEFQRNLGLPVDAILGADTLSELRRVMPRPRDVRARQRVRDRDRLRHLPKTLLGRLHRGGRRGRPRCAGLRRPAEHCTGRERTLYLSFIPTDRPRRPRPTRRAPRSTWACGSIPPSHRCTTSHYSGYRYESAGGRRLAELLQGRVPAVLGSSTCDPEGCLFRSSERRGCRQSSARSARPLWSSSAHRPSRRHSPKRSPSGPRPRWTENPLPHRSGLSAGEAQVK